jgi:hypothetical protein
VIIVYFYNTRIDRSRRERGEASATKIAQAGQRGVQNAQWDFTLSGGTSNCLALFTDVGRQC